MAQRVDLSSRQELPESSGLAGSRLRRDVRGAWHPDAPSPEPWNNHNVDIHATAPEAVDVNSPIRHFRRPPPARTVACRRYGCRSEQLPGPGRKRVSRRRPGRPDVRPHGRRAARRGPGIRWDLMAHDHLHDRREADRRALKAALGLIVALMAVEVAAGIVASSLALLSDAAHMLTDAAALGL